MTSCQICHKMFGNINGLGKHIHANHQIERKQYYDLYVGIVSSTCICGSEKKFRNIAQGYREFCSPKCRSKHIVHKTPWLGKKQPQEMIDKRRKTQIEKYGVACGFLVGHSRAVRYKNLICRSNYEKTFLDFAEKFNYTVEVPQKIQYVHEGRNRYYFPDFYLKELDLIVEVKSDWTWRQQIDLNISKLTSALDLGYRIVVIDEEDGLLDHEKWEELNEYLRLV